MSRVWSWKRHFRKVTSQQIELEKYSEKRLFRSPSSIPYLILFLSAYFSSSCIFEQMEFWLSDLCQMSQKELAKTGWNCQAGYFLRIVGKGLTRCLLAEPLQILNGRVFFELSAWNRTVRSKHMKCVHVQSNGHSQTCQIVRPEMYSTIERKVCNNS